MTLDSVLTALASVIKGEEIDSKLLDDGEVKSTLAKYFTERSERSELVDLIKEPEVMLEYLYLDEEDKTNLGIKLKIEKVSNEDTLISLVDTTIVLFDHYLEVKKTWEVFGQKFMNSRRLNDKFNDVGRKIYVLSSILLKPEGGFRKILEFASKKREEILNYSTFGEVLKTEGPEILTRAFDYFLKNKKDGQRFNTRYLQRNKDLNKALSGLPNRLYKNCLVHLREEGGINCIVERVVEERPEIRDHWKFNYEISRRNRK
jgi:ubiquinone biosynthesis protein Coq4